MIMMTMMMMILNDDYYYVFITYSRKSKNTMYMLKRSLLFIIGHSQAAFVLPVHMNCELNPAVKPLETTRGLIIC